MAQGKASKEPPGASPPAPAPRSTVVLRAGPSRRKGLVADLSTAILGAILLVACVWLVNALPVTDHPPNEFRVKFVPVSTNLTAQTLELSEAADGRNVDFHFEVPDENVYKVDFQVSFRDDVNASRPDVFRFELFRQDGEPAGSDDVPIANAPGMVASMAYSVTLTPKPQDAIVVAVQGATAEDVERALEQRHHLISAGRWRIHVTLDDAGDCAEPPVPPSSQDDVARFVACQQEAQAAQGPDADPRNAGMDLGNPFTVGVFTYTRFEVHAERFE